MGVPRRYGHPPLSALHRALLEEAIEQAEIEIERKLRAAVLLAADRHLTEVARELGVSLADLKAMTSTMQVDPVRVDLGDNLTRSRSTDWQAIFDGASETGANVVFDWSNLNLFPLGTGNVFADILETRR